MEERHQRKFAAGVGPRRQWKKVSELSTKSPSGTRATLPSRRRPPWREHGHFPDRPRWHEISRFTLETPAVREHRDAARQKYGEEGQQLIASRSVASTRRGRRDSRRRLDLFFRSQATAIERFASSSSVTRFSRLARRPAGARDASASSISATHRLDRLDRSGRRSQLAAVSDVLLQLGFADFVVRLNHRGGPVRTTASGRRRKRPTYADAQRPGQTSTRRPAGGVASRSAARNSSGHRRTCRLERFAVPATELPATPFIASRKCSARTMALLQIFARLCPRRRRHPLETVRIDLNLARGPSYYTGASRRSPPISLAASAAVEGTTISWGCSWGATCRRGFSLGLERIIVVMTERNMFPAERSARSTSWSRCGTIVARRRADPRQRTARGRPSRRCIRRPTSSGCWKACPGATCCSGQFAGDDEQGRGMSDKDLRSGDQQTADRRARREHVATRRQS